MTTVTAELIPDGSYALRVFRGDDVPGESNIETVLVLRNLGDGVCEMSLARGKLYNEANMLIGIKAYELGFRELRFHVLKGKTVTRWAEKVSSHGTFDFYRVDLGAAVMKYVTDIVTDRAL
jgi:hypothetical protein